MSEILYRLVCLDARNVNITATGLLNAIEKREQALLGNRQEYYLHSASVD